MTPAPLTVDQYLDLIWHDHLFHFGNSYGDHYGWREKYRSFPYHPEAVRHYASSNPVLAIAYERWASGKDRRREQAVDMLAQVIREATAREDGLPEKEPGSERERWGLFLMSHSGGPVGVALEACERVLAEHGGVL